MRLMQTTVQGTFCTVYIGGKGKGTEAVFLQLRAGPYHFPLPFGPITGLRHLPRCHDGRGGHQSGRYF
jgi:hypothetical protein